MDTNAIINLVTPVFATLVTAGIKALLPKIPKWTIPIVCTIAGALGNVAAHYAATQNQEVVTAILLALAGVGVREIKDQLTPSTVPQAVETAKAAEANLAKAESKEAGK